jgi:hypothetical protein
VKKIVKPAAFYGNATWAMIEIDMTTLGIWDRKQFRRIYGPVVGQGICRIRNRIELREVYEDQNMVADIKTKAWN